MAKIESGGNETSPFERRNKERERERTVLLPAYDKVCKLLSRIADPHTSLSDRLHTKEEIAAVQRAVREE